MRISRPVTLAAIAVSAAACGQGETQNVMVPRATPLTEAQVERALGPEPQTERPSRESGTAEPAEPDDADEAIPAGPAGETTE